MGNRLRKYKCPKLNTNPCFKILNGHSSENKLEEFYQRMTPYKSIKPRQFYRQRFSNRQKTDNSYAI